MRTWLMMRMGLVAAVGALMVGCAGQRCCCCGEEGMGAKNGAAVRGSAMVEREAVALKEDAAGEKAVLRKGPTLGLVAYYGFEGDARDSSGRGNDGEASGDVKYGDGVFGKAVQFGGVDSPGHIRVAASEKMTFGEAMSVAFWVKVEGDATATWMDGSGRKVPLAGQVVVAKSGDRVGFMIKRGQEDNGVRGIDVTAHAHTDKVAGASAEEAVPLHEWVHIVLVAGKGGTQIYRDGKLVAQDKKVIDLSEVNGEDLYVGIQAGKGSVLPWWGPLNGMVDELRIYDRELTREEIGELAKRE